MLRTGGEHQRQATRSSRKLLVFSVGGRPLAVNMSDVVTIFQWTECIPVASRTPFITAVVRRGHTVLPVFELASALRLSVQGDNPLCLQVKHPLGDMVMCIDEGMTGIHSPAPSAIHTYQGKDLPAKESYTNGLDEIPILDMSRFGSYT